MTTFTTSRGNEIHYKDFGNGQPIVLSHGWPLSSDAWEKQIISLVQAGYRVIAHDRRGHGKSEATFDNNNMNTYADDLGELIEKLDLKNAILVGHSTGGGEITRYTGRHGTSRVAGLVLISAVTPGMAKNGVPMSIFDDIRANTLANRSQYYKDFTEAFFGANRPGIGNTRQGMRDTFWFIGMQGNLKAQYDSIAAFSETDFTEDLQKLDVPTLILHGDDDQIVPFDISAPLAHKLAKGSELKVYKGGAHALPDINADEVSADIKAFAESIASGSLKKAS